MPDHPLLRFRVRMAVPAAGGNLENHELVRRREEDDLYRAYVADVCAEIQAEKARKETEAHEPPPAPPPPQEGK